MSEIEIAVLAVRLLGLSVAVLLLPGLLLLASLRVAAEWPERVVLAFSLSYSWVFVLSIVVPLFGWTVDAAAALTLLLLVVAGGIAARRAIKGDMAVPPGSRRRLGALLVAAVVIAGAIAGWVIEPPITGEEALDLASLSRFADGGPITFENTSLFPDTRPVYLFQPYQLALGIIARWSGTDPLIALVKFRSFLAPLSLVLLYSLLKRLTPTRVEAAAAFVVVLLFITLDMETWEWNSLFPFVRRGGVGAGICVPALLGLCLAATRRAQDSGARKARRVALVTAPVMLVASLSTHPLEMFTLLCFVGGMALTICSGIDRTADRTHTLVLVMLLASATGAYLAIHSRAVPYVAEYEREDQQSLRAELGELASDPITAIAGGPTAARDLLSRTIPSTTAVVFGIPAMVLAVFRAPAAAAMLALGVVPLALLYASQAGFIALTLLTSVETVRDVGAYFALLGILALALGLTALAHAILHAAAWRQKGFDRVVSISAVGSVVMWAAWTGGQEAVQWLGSRAVMRPEWLLLIAVLVAGVVLIVAAMRTRVLVPPAPFPSGVMLVTACLAIPLAIPNWAFGGIFARREPVTAFGRFEAALASPSVLDWPSYYEELKRSIAPPLPVPRSVVDELRTRIPPRQIVLAHPRYSCALVVLLDAYCINPESVSGHYFQPAARYLAEYVDREDGQPPRHPFFSASTSLTAGEDRLLTEYHVSYLLADPEHAEQIGRKLGETTARATLEMEQDGYRLYRISSS